MHVHLILPRYAFLMARQQNGVTLAVVPLCNEVVGMVIGMVIKGIENTLVTNLKLSYILFMMVFENQWITR